MKIACCFRDALLRTRFAERLTREGLVPEPYGHELDLIRSLRHRGGVGLAVVDVGRDPSVEDCILSWLRCRGGEPLPTVLVAPYWTPGRIAAALEAGADDCLTIPFDFAEAVARIRALLRRASAARNGADRLEVAGFVLDRTQGCATDRGAPLGLMPREFALAWLLFANAGQRLTRDAISLAVWGTGKDIACRTIEQHVYKLRRKLRLGADRGVVLRTTYGQSYRLDLCGREHTCPLPTASADRIPCAQA